MFKGVFLDQFGVMHDGRQPYPGAVEALQTLAESRKILIISNSSRRSTVALEKLTAMGFDAGLISGQALLPAASLHTTICYDDRPSGGRNSAIGVITSRGEAEEQ